MNISLFGLKDKPTFPLPKGLYRFPQLEESRAISLHLRVETDQNSQLVINGNTILQLNPTATWMAYLA